MKVGFVGLGKLGYPYALWLDSYRRHEVIGYDASPDVRERVRGQATPDEQGGEIATAHTILVAESPDDLASCALVFVVVQTPHRSGLDGSTWMEYRTGSADFDYRYLSDALFAIPDGPEIVVVSTCLPGTYRRLYAPRRLVYAPAFAAMGTVLADLAYPEFLLIGAEGPDALRLDELWGSLYADETPRVYTDITTAEGIKVAYNSFVSAKVVLANLWGELADKIGMDVDAISHSWELSTDRILSPRYLRAGMGDGGPCHPRDLIALDWLAGQHKAGPIFRDLLDARQRHVSWMASMVPDGAVIFGTAYKPESTLTAGSSALLLTSVLAARGKRYHQDEDPTPGAYNVIATAHERYRKIRWPQGSTVLDPFGIIADQEGVTVRRLGRP